MPATRTNTVVEPKLTITQTQNATHPLQVGTVITFSTALYIPSTQTAFDTTISIVSDPDLQYVSGTLMLNGVAYTDFVVSGGNLTLGQSGLLDIPAGQTYTLQYQRVVLSGQPLQQLREYTYVNWTSIQGSNKLGPNLAALNSTYGERLYSSTTYTTVITIAPITATTTISFTSEAASTGSNVVVGEQLEYTIVVSIPRCSASSITVLQTLPIELSLLSEPTISYGAGISFLSSTRFNNVLGSAGWWNVTWSSVNSAVYLSGTNNTILASTADRQITLRFPVQVLNVASASSGKILMDRSFLSFGSTSPSLISNLASPSQVGNNITVIEPNLTASISQATSFTTIQFGDVLRYTMCINDTSSIAGFDLQVAITVASVVDYVSGSSRIIVGGSGYNAAASEAFNDPTITTGPTLTWGRSQSSYNATLSLLASASVSVPIYLTFDLLVSQSINPSQVFHLFYPHINSVLS